MKLLVALFCSALLALAGCGGGDTSTGSSDGGNIGAEIDDLCTEQAAFALLLPKKQAEEDLTTAEIQQIAEDKAEEFRQSIEALDEPSELADAKQDLLDELQASVDDPPQDLVDFKERGEKFSAAYSELGADRCVAYGEASIKVFDGASVREAYKGLPLPGVTDN